MKLIIQTQFFFFLLTMFCFAQWYQQNSGTTKNLNAVHFVDANNGWVVGDSGTIIKTTDGGVTWMQQSVVTNHDLRALDFKSINTGWIVGGSDSAIVLKTTDGGLNWIRQLSIGNISDNVFSDVCFIDENKGYVVGPAVYHTTDGGLSWSNQFYSGGYSIDFVDENTGWLVNMGGVNGCPISYIWKTTDGGANWQEQFEISGDKGRIRCFDSNYVLAVAALKICTILAPGGIFKTSNGGADWFKVSESCYEVSISSVNIATAVTVQGSYGTILRSTDSGNTFLVQQIDSVGLLSGVSFTDDFTGWAVGNNGTILHTTNGGATFVEEEQIDEVPTEFLLSNNYPNPFNPSTKIKYSIPQSSNVVIKVFDVLGNELKTLVNEEKTVGTYEITWYAENLPSGVYFYQLRAGDFIQTRKMILMK